MRDAQQDYEEVSRLFHSSQEEVSRLAFEVERLQKALVYAADDSDCERMPRNYLDTLAQARAAVWKKPKGKAHA